MAAIDVKTQLVIDKIVIDAKARQDLDDMYKKYVSGGGSKNKAEFEKYARRQGITAVGEKAERSDLQKITDDPLKAAMKGLTSVLEIGLKNSKIVQVFVKKVGEALGLLVDLILLPFLPILIWALIALFKAVLWLGDMWKKFVASVGLDKVKLPELPTGNKSDGSPKSKTEQVIDAVSFLNDLVKAWENAMLRIYAAVFLGFANIVIGVATWVWELGVEIATALADGLWSIMPQWMKEIVAQLDKAWAEILLGLDELHKMVDTIPQWFNELGGNISKWFDEQWAILTVELEEIGKAWEVFYAMLTSGFKAFVNIFIALLNLVINTIRKVPILGALIPEGATIPLLAEGGTVSKTGIAVVHAGETVIPAGKGNTTFNFYGYQDDVFIKKIRDVMRSDATRYSQ